MKLAPIIAGFASIALCGAAVAARWEDRLSQVHERFLEDRRAVLPSLSDPFGVPEAARVVVEAPRDISRFRLRNIPKNKAGYNWPHPGRSHGSHIWGTAKLP